MKNIVVFDFDSTLCFTPEPEEGKKIWYKQTGTIFPHDGWWSKPESLDINVFFIALNEWVYRKYIEAIADENNYVILATGRLEKLRKNVEKILNLHNLSFDEILLNKGGSTLSYKMYEFENLIHKFKPKMFTMYDDRYDHISEFKKWAVKQPCKIKIINVTNKISETFNETKT